MRILLVEDNKVIAKGLVYTLSSNGYTVKHCDSYASGLAASGGEYDLLIFDVTLPDGNGFELYSEIRHVNPAPVIFLTALDDENNIVRGFDIGAEDYITKPFSTRELLARIKRILRSKAAPDNTITAGDVSINTEKQIVMKNGTPVELTALEYRIFLMLMQNLGKTVSRDAIMEKIWDISGNYVNDNTLTVYIKRIRKKLDTDMLKTIKGMGYRMDEK